MIGLATKAGKTVSGEFATEKAVKEGKAFLVVVAEDASENTKKLFRNKCEFYKTEYLVFGSKIELGLATGREMRASIAVTDKGLCSAILKKLENSKNNVNENGGI